MSLILSLTYSLTNVIRETRDVDGFKLRFDPEKVSSLGEYAIIPSTFSRFKGVSYPGAGIQLLKLAGIVINMRCNGRNEEMKKRLWLTCKKYGILFEMSNNLSLLANRDVIVRVPVIMAMVSELKTRVYVISCSLLSLAHTSIQGMGSPMD